MKDRTVDLTVYTFPFNATLTPVAVSVDVVATKMNATKIFSSVKLPKNYESTKSSSKDLAKASNKEYEDHHHMKND